VVFDFQTTAFKQLLRNFPAIVSLVTATGYPEYLNKEK